MEQRDKKGCQYDLRWTRLIQGMLIKRYQRFKADVKLRNNHRVTAHCPNSGSMLSCSEPGRSVYLSRHNRPSRKLNYTWEMIQMPTSPVGVNTIVPNRLVRRAAATGKIDALKGYDSIRSEVRYGKNSRIDLLFEKEGEVCFVEIKNCTLMEDGIGYFPDAVTSRGLKHLVELQEMIRMGSRCVMFYLVQRMDVKLFRPADHIDPAYGQELRKAVDCGVEVLAYDVNIDQVGISIRGVLPFEL
jgi:sugar fermentation stimulation protein A